jgi:hypothetical protein
MNMFLSAPRFTRLSLAGALALGLATLSGCGIGSITTGSTGPVSMATISGNVHGGQQPVTNSTIQLWTVGTTGYGSAGVNLLGSTVVKTSLTDGSFNITGDYTCPSASTLVYITASGGNPGMTVGTNNAALKLAAPLGPCGNLGAGTFVVINEVTTAAAAFALGQYFTPTFGTSSPDTFGAPNTAQAQVGIANAFATVNNLVNTATGNAVTSGSLTGPAGTITTTPESAKLDTVADIIASCVNSDGSGTSPCQTTLFADVTPTGALPATDTLQAAVYMSLNPTSNNANGSVANLTALYGLQTAQSPFVGAAAQPTDWTVGILYTSATALLEPQNIEADAAGNIWVVSEGSSALGNLAELSPTGTPLVSSVLTSGSLTLTALNPRNIAIDLNGNVFVPTSSSSGTLFEYNPSSAAVTSINVGKSPYGIAIDGNNNVFVGAQSATATFELSEFVNGNLSTNSEVQYPLVGQASISTFATNVAEPEYMAFDSTGALWFDPGSSSTANTTVYQLSNINTSSCGTPPFASLCQVTSNTTQNTYASVTAGPLAEPWGLAADTTGMWVANALSGTNSLTLLTSPTTGNDFGTSASVVGPHYLAVDGAGNVWAPSKTVSPGGVSEFSSTGTVLSPTTTPVGFSHTGISISVSSSVNGGITIDPSGNVWIADNVAAGATDANSVFEIVGAAAPTVTPLPLQLKNGTVGMKP